MEPEDSSHYTLHGRELVEYLVQRASDDAKAALIERDERRNRRTAFFMSIIALIGIGGLVNAVKVYVRSEVDVLQVHYKEQQAGVEKLIDDKTKMLRSEFTAKVETAVSNEVDGKIGAVLKRIDENDQFEQYSELAMQLPEKVAGINQRGDKYVAETLREVLAAAQQLALNERLKHRARFLMATRQIVDVMTRLNRESEVNRLDDLLGPAMATDQELARILVDHYGQLVIGSPQSIDAMSDDVNRLNRYLRAAKELNYPEKALVWTLFVEFKRNNYIRNTTTDRLLESSKDLTERDRAEFWFNLTIYTNPLNWMMAPDQQGRELARLMDRLSGEYKEAGVKEAMEQNLAANVYLQTRLANQRAKNPSWHDEPPSTASGDSPAPEPPETAVQTREHNALR